MKSFLSILLLSFSAVSLTAEEASYNNQELDIQLASDPILQKSVKILGYDGALVREFALNDVANNKISVLDNLILDQSDFAFDYQGDYYYFGSAIDKSNLLY